MIQSIHLLSPPSSLTLLTLHNSHHSRSSETCSILPSSYAWSLLGNSRGTCACFWRCHCSNVACSPPTSSVTALYYGHSPDYSDLDPALPLVQPSLFSKLLKCLFRAPSRLIFRDSVLRWSSESEDSSPGLFGVPSARLEIFRVQPGTTADVT